MTLKGVPQDRRNAQWHTKHLKRLVKRKHHVPYVAPIYRGADVLPEPVIEKPSVWRRILNFFGL